jgi:hypothetical protein
MSRVITTAQRRRLDQLLGWSERHKDALDKIHAEVVAITGDPDPDNGHSVDAVHSRLGITTASLLRRLGVKVGKP